MGLLGSALLSLSTPGGQLVTINGAQFGPATPVDPLRVAGFIARYGADPTALSINATGCQV
jgi:hypothetical protein